MWNGLIVGYASAIEIDQGPDKFISRKRALALTLLRIYFKIPPIAEQTAIAVRWIGLKGVQCLLVSVI